MIFLVPALDLVVATTAAATIVILRDVALLAPSKDLRRAWQMLGAVLGCCVLLLLLHAWYNIGRQPDMGDCVGVAIFLMGVSFIYAVAWLSRRTARDMLRMQDMARYAYCDALTGIGNRRHFTDLLDAAVAEAGSSGGTLYLISADIDHFKTINDLHGHAAGDEVLRRVATELVVHARPGTACRIGGEEFAVLLRDVDAAFAIMLAEQLRAAVAELVVELHEGVTLQVQISLGMAALAQGETSTALQIRADAALYAAKRAGRDQLKLAA